MKTFAELDLEPLPLLQEDTATTRRRLRDAREIGAFAKGPFGPLVIRHAAVTELLHDKRLRGVGTDLSRLSGIPEGSRTARRQQNIPLFMEGEDHHRLRRLVAKAFTPRAVEALRPYTRTVIGGLVDAVFDAHRCEAVESLTNPFPIPVICALVGIEPDRIDDMSRWAGSVLLALRLDAGTHLAEIEQAQAELDDYIGGLIALRRKLPRDDLLSRLIAVEEAIRWQPATQAALADADRFDITREAPGDWQLLTFGGGVHYCLGANLARVELTEALAELSARFTTLRADGEAVLSPPGSPIRGYQRLPIAWS